MKKQLRDDWVKALRSNEFVQHRGSACNADKNSHCCLDVLRIVSGDKGKHCATFKGYEFSSALRNRILKLVGGDGKFDELARRNDGIHGFRPHSFSEIAEWVEANVEVTP